MEKFKFRYLLCSLLLGSLFVYSCSDDSLTSSLNSQDEIELVDTRNSMINYNQSNKKALINEVKSEFTKELSSLVSRDSKVLNQFVNLSNTTEKNGHYDDEFFWNVEKDKIVIGNRSLSELLVDQNPNNLRLLDFICNNIPALTILKLGNDNASLGLESKIYYDNGFDDMDNNVLVPYFLNGISGNTILLNEPTKTTFIVRECETYVSPEKFKSPSYLKTKNNEVRSLGVVCGNDILVYGRPPGGGGPSGPTGGGEDPCDFPCERDCINKTENIHRFRTSNDYESWRGKGEFIIYSIFTNNVTYTEDANGEVVITGGALDYVIHQTGGVEDNDEFIFPNHEIFIWDLDNDGDRMKHVWYEDDGGGSVTRDITLAFEYKGASVSWDIPIRYRSDDDFIGESIVDYCQDIDSNGFEYHPSSDVDFYMNER